MEAEADRFWLGGSGSRLFNFPGSRSGSGSELFNFSGSGSGYFLPLTLTHPYNFFKHLEFLRWDSNGSK